MSTPFDNVRWEKDKTVPFVHVKGKWYILSAVNGIDAQVIVSNAKAQFGEMYQEVVSENIVLVIYQEVSDSLEVDVEDIETSEVETFTLKLRSKLEGTPEYCISSGDTPVEPGSTQGYQGFTGNSGDINPAAGQYMADMERQQKKQLLMSAFGSIMQFAKMGLKMSLLEIVQAYEDAGGKVVEDEEDAPNDGTHEM